MGIKRHILIIFVLFLTATGAYAQPGKDKVVNLQGKKFYQHIVVKGETVYGVAKDFNVSVKDIVLENPKAIDGINPGDTLHVPVFVPGPVPPVNATGLEPDTANKAFTYHKVAPKETLYSLSKQYGVSMNTLDSLNPDLKDKGLKAGMILRIPNKGYKANAPTTNNQQTVKDTTKEKQAFKNLVQQEQGTQTTQPVTKPGQLLKRYNVALMLAFMPQEVDSVKMNRLLDGSQQFPLLAQISADFYNGARIALDSLAMQGFDVSLHVYNIPTDSADHKIDSLLKLPELANMNLIIGPPYPSHFKLVAKFAMQHQIPIVSPLSDENYVLHGNPYASKAVPSPSTQMEQLADYVAAHGHNSNIIIMHNHDGLDDTYYDILKKRLNTSLSIAEPKSDSATVVNYSDELSELGKKMNSQKNNIIIAPYQSTSFVIKMLNQLANSKYAQDSVELFGMQRWTSMDAVDLNNLDTLHFHFPSNEYIDYTNRAVSRFILKYRSMYYTEPNYYACQGFDVVYYYAGLLLKYGTGLQDHLTDTKYKGIHTCFDFYKPDPDGGFENKGIYFLEYKNLSLVKDTQ